MSEAQADQFGKWHSVDRSPEDMARVLVWVAGEGWDVHRIGIYIAGFPAYVDDGPDGVPMDGVTHWMRLPPPPR